MENWASNCDTGTLADAVKDLGSPEQIRGVFVGFQRYLYQSPRD